jgi:uncharacterized protein (TIGR03067 family)
MNRVCVVGLIALLVVDGSAAPVPKAVKTDDATAVLGKWHVESVHTATEVSEDYPKDVTFDFRSATAVVQTWAADKTERRYTYTLDTKESPRRLSLTRDGSKHTDRCVYELAGDTLLLGFLEDEKAVPAKLVPAKGLVLYTMKRVKDGK